MALVVNTNIASLQSQYSLSQSRSALEQAMERLSSGSRINSAGDDAAGLSISTRMDSQIRGLEAAISNANDGISLLQTAEGAMEEITAMLQRMRELAVQSSNGVNNAADRDALNEEAQQLLSEIDRVVGDTTFNDQAILDGSMRTQLQIGSEAGQSLAVNLGNLSTYALGGNVASTSAQVQRDAAISGAAVGSTDENGNNLVTATNVGLTFQADDTYNFVLSLELRDNEGATKTFEYDISGVVSGGSARDIALEIQSALRQPPMSAGVAADAGTITEVVNSAASLVDVTFSGNTINISNKLGGDVTLEAGNYRTDAGIQSSIGGPVSESGGVIHFSTPKQREQDGSVIADDSRENVIIGTQPDFNATSFSINSVAATTTTTSSTDATEATAATLEVALADINDSTFSTLNQVSSGDTIAFALVDEDGDQTLVFTDELTGVGGSTALVGALNNALVSAGALGDEAGQYSFAWGANAAGGSDDGSETTPGTFVITRADGKNFTIINDVSEFSADIEASFATTQGDAAVDSVGLMRAVVDLAQADSSLKTSDDDITLNFSDGVAGSIGATSVFTAGDGFTLTLTDEGGIAKTVIVDDLQDGSISSVASALNTALQNAALDDTYAATVDGSDATGGMTITHSNGQEFTLAFSDLTIGGASTGLTTVIHEKLDDLEFADAVNNSLFSTNGVQESASVSETSTTTPNGATMYLDVLGADKYTLTFNSTATPGTVTDQLTFTYDGTDAGLDSFASSIQANLDTLGAAFDFTVTADAGRIEITENSGDGFGVASFTSEGSGRIMASADSSVIPTGQSGVAMLDDTTFATNATADAGVAGANVAATEMQLTFTDATDTYSFSIETDDGVAKVNPFLYDNGASGGENADAVAAISVALRQAGLDGIIQVEAGDTDQRVNLTAASGEEIRITDFRSENSGQITVESLAGTFGSGVGRILNDDVFGASNALANLDISTSNGALTALDAIDRALQGVSDERANIGALTNRLDHTISNLGNIVVNTSAAQSRIQDADFASEAAELAKAQVLQQAGTAILAQANASVQSVLSLLG